MIVRAIKKLLHRMIGKTENGVGVKADHLHFIVNTSVRAFFDLMSLTKLTSHRDVMPAHTLHIARIVATQGVDCGSCVQFAVNVALKDGVPGEWIRATLEHRPEALPLELREVYEFTGHVLQHTYAEDELREAIRARYGDRGLIDLAYAIASAQVMPLTKQALGFAKSCSKVVVTVPAAPSDATPSPARTAA